MSPAWSPATLVQCVAAVMAGCTTSLLTNPLDLVRTRVQVILSSLSSRYSLLSASQTQHHGHNKDSLENREDEDFPERLEVLITDIARQLTPALLQV